MFEKYLNKLEERITHISGSNFKPGVFSLEWFLTGISYGYGLGVWFRLWLYKKGILKQKTLPCFVISIGNIVVGGAGKTPVAIYVANLLKEMGKRPVVISRGYRGKYKDHSVIVSDGDRIFIEAEESGDEPYMMAKRRSFPVVVGKDRFAAGIRAIDAFKPDVIVLDDGFQHLKLKRDLDFLLLDYSNPLGNKRFLPAGRLRETPQASAQRADALIFTRSPDENISVESIEEMLSLYPGCPWFKTFHKPFVCQQIVEGLILKEDTTDIDVLNGRKAVLFSGLADNESFYRSALKLNVNILHHLEFKDHYYYKKPDIYLINSMAKKMGADLILTTEKDWTKLEKDIQWGANLIVIGIQIEFEYPEKFKDFLISGIEKQ
ncbi:MAG: tetraacyldisaccharide 4'-kinase [Desulfobacula sp.]|uniref:tetraacyldisaccharide 4'-kinase n=1 Tax=Desulfobacula sp. TaxID=2593537 RepID=UPI0025BDD444|nr:tetraacyldisaccharide 4'-kinase [Desulfobacula sp.]MCD4721705.1 tetraacyldisaccharide 4'-kinase [Desulfobacula sp.]